mgnify:CR=1 FL=1
MKVVLNVDLVGRHYENDFWPLIVILRSFQRSKVHEYLEFFKSATFRRVNVKEFQVLLNKE